MVAEQHEALVAVDRRISSSEFSRKAPDSQNHPPPLSHHSIIQETISQGSKAWLRVSSGLQLNASES
jgi:hypothetical protein